jgi:aryl carrier-like protein
MDKIRAGLPVANAELIEFSRTFKEDLMLDKLSKAQLVSICKYMEVPTYGGVTLMKMLLQNRFRQLKKDDQVIFEEGLDSLNFEELQGALRDRGMRGSIDSQPVLKRRLAEWLDLSLIHKLPISMLVLSRALTFTENEKYEQTLQENLAYLPANLVDEVINSNLDANIEYLSQRAIELREKKAKEDKEKEKAAEAVAKETVAAATSTTTTATKLKGFMAPLDNAISEAQKVDDLVGMGKFHLLDTNVDDVLTTAELNKLLNGVKQKAQDEDVRAVLDQLEGKMSTKDILKFAAERESLQSQSSLPNNQKGRV